MDAYRARRIRQRVLHMLAPIALLVVPGFSHAQASAPDGSSAQPTPTPQASPSPTSAAQPSPTPVPNLENTIDAGDSPDEPVRQLVHWNEYQGPYFTVRAGGGLLLDYNAFAQDPASKEQFALFPQFRLRDFRFLLSGKFPQFERSVTWCAGIMYDAPTHSWRVRQTGVQIQVPNLWGYLFIGRTKEGFSLEKVMNGYDGWWMERFTMNDATVPLLADGFRWMGYSPKHGFLWNLGYFNDLLSKGQSFSSYSSQWVARPIWLPIHSEEKAEVLHLGFDFRYGIPVDHELQLKSRPEAFPAPFFLDTGQFPANSSHSEGYEVYYRQGSLLLGSEYWWQQIDAPSRGNPTVQGGDFMGAWLITGEVRPYNTIGGVFKDITPATSVFSGGPGAWELVLRYSTTDLNNKGLTGGTFKRFTPMVNWYLSDNVRLEFTYGYGVLNRFGLNGTTQFFQTRVQFQL